jgi:DNA repair protein RecN (Recombination protein N)
VVEGLFELEGEIALPEQLAGSRDDSNRELLIRRVVAEGGRSRVFIDGELATVQTLARMGAALVQVYGQHEQQSLLRAESHREILDRFAGLDEPLAAYRDAYRRAQELHTRLADLERRERERAGLLELARFRVAELERAEISPAEDAALQTERTVLANATKLGTAAHDAEQALYGADGSALESIARVERQLADAAVLDPSLNSALELLASARANLEEAALTLGRYAQRIEADPARLEQVEVRLQHLNQLKRKYGGSLDSALETLESSRAEIAELERVGESKAEANAALTAALDDLAARARKLTASRSRAGAELKRKVEAELRTLGMRAPVFETRIESLARDEAGFTHEGLPLGLHGADAVEFYIAPNLGQPPMPLLRIASGGELSRVMLALKRLEAQRRGVATMIFDEVDAGIGGEVAMVVGRKLKELSRFHQVLCITHLAQIAAFADHHLLVEKEERRGSTKSRVTMLDAGDRAEEIARMLSGAEITEKFRRAARELLDRARA